MKPIYSIVSRAEYGGLIAGGATVNISAPSVEVVNEFEVRHGGILNINQK